MCGAACAPWTHPAIPQADSGGTMAMFSKVFPLRDLGLRGGARPLRY